VTATSTSTRTEALRKAFDLAHTAAQNPRFSIGARAAFRAIRHQVWMAAGQPAEHADPAQPAAAANKVTRVIWKDEGEAGPVWVVYADAPDERKNYQDSTYARPDEGFFPAWFSEAAARIIAERHGVELETR
jgi:hypothetical protein